MSDVILFLTPKQTVGEFIADLNSMDKNLLNQIWPSPCIFMVENETKFFEKYSDVVDFNNILDSG